MMENFSNLFHYAAVVALSLALIGCGEDAPPEERPEAPYPLIEAEGWERTDEDDDPFDDRPAQVDCPDDATGTEELDGELVYEVKSDSCDYLTARQETLAPVFAGDAVSYRVFHFALTGPEGATAHLALRLGERTLLDEEVAIPGDSRLYAGEVVVEEDFPEGTPAYFHVHNHGSNQYSIIELSAEAP